jgi:hypothetical protein
MNNILIRLANGRLPLRAVLARRIIKTLSLLSYVDRLRLGLVDRPNYGHCIWHATKLAYSLKYTRISIIEFGCGGGNGLLNAEWHITEALKVFPIEIELYGFDLGSGLPQPEDYRDMPYYFKRGLYTMDRASLEKRLTRAKLVIGDVKHTCTTFFDDYRPAPIGCIFYDLDFYSSTCAALKLQDANSEHFLPRVLMYFDDIIGNNETWLCNDFTGERLAIHEFNRDHTLKKISKDFYLPTKYPSQWWTEHVYVCHDFVHPKYNEFVAVPEQQVHRDAIELH